ncbi:hypothetical protein Tco_0596119 [Tanacetum coccineum]
MFLTVVLLWSFCLIITPNYSRAHVILPYVGKDKSGVSYASNFGKDVSDSRSSSTYLSSTSELFYKTTCSQSAKLQEPCLYGTRRKSLGARKKSSTELDLTADDRSFIRVLSDDSDDSNDDDDPPIFWPAFAAWEVGWYPTGLGDVNALYFMDNLPSTLLISGKILHLVVGKNMFKLYEWLFSGMVLVFEADHQQWVIRSWRIFPIFSVRYSWVGDIFCKILYMFADTPYPLSAQLIKKMLKHKLEAEIDGIGNDMTYVEQLIHLLVFINLLLKLVFENGFASGILVFGILFWKLGSLGFLNCEEQLVFRLILVIHPRLDADFLVADSKFMKVAFGVGFKMIVVPSFGVLLVPMVRVKVLLVGYSQNSKACIILNKHTRKVEESLNVTFDETPPLSKTPPLVDDDLDKEEAIKVIKKKNLENDIEDETLEIDKIVNIKDSRNHPLENFTGNLNQRTLRSQAQNQSNFFCFISTIEHK